MSEDQRSTEAAQLETIDRRIISALADDGRISMTALAEKVHISRAHCYSRLQYLQNTGVITGFSVTVNPEKLGLGASAHVILKLRQHNWRALRQKLVDIPEIWHGTRTGGPRDDIW